MEAGKFIGLGAGSGGAYWDRENILAVAQYSPQIALAKAMRVPFAPFLLPIVNTFADATNLTSNPQTFQGNANIGATGLGGEPTIVDGIIFEIDAPNANQGNALKPVSDFFYGLNSGIQATMMVDGAPKYTVAPFYTPLRMLCTYINESWPSGWVLNHNQSIIMQFYQAIPIPYPPVTITVGFRMWQPIDTAGIFVQMTTGDAYARLASLGYDVSSAAQPVNR